MAESLISTKPYMVRAIHEWCMDNGMTPHLLVVVNAQTRVPQAYVKDGEIVLNLSYSATKDLHIDNDAVVFSARFGGVSQSLYVPMNAVCGIFARENGQGMFFEFDAKDNSSASPSPSEVLAPDEVVEDGDKAAKADSDAKASKKRPTLTIVK